MILDTARRRSKGTELVAAAQARKVLHIIARLNVGGPAINVVLLTDQVDRIRFQSSIVAGIEGPAEGSMRYLADERGIEPFVIPEMGREISLRDDLRSLIKLMRLIRRERPDIIHTHTAKAGTLGRIGALVALPGRRKQLIHTFHGHVFHGYFGPRKSRAFILVERVLARYSSCLIAVSDQTKRELVEYGVAPADKIKVIELGLDLSPFLESERCRGELRAEIGVQPDAILVGIVARLVPIKAIDVFLRAAQRVAASTPEAFFVVVGDGEIRSELESLAAALGLTSRIRFLGYRKDLARIYADLDIFVLSSLNEGLPTSVVEALAAGKVVVATRVGGVPDLIEDGSNGYLAPPADPAGLACAIERAIEQRDLWPALGAAGRADVVDRFSLERLVRDMEQLYSS